MKGSGRSGRAPGERRAARSPRPQSRERSRPSDRPPRSDRSPRSSTAAPRPLALQVAELALWLLVLGLPLVVLPSARESFRLPKLMVGEWLGLASLVGVAYRLRDPAGLLRGRALRAAAPLVLVAVAGLAVSRHPLHVHEGLADLAIGAACLVGWSLGLESGRLLRLLDALLWAAVALALLAILQFHGLYRPLDFRGVAAGSRLAVTSLAGNPGDLAVFLVLPFLLAQRRLLAGRAGAGRWLAGIALLLSGYALAVTQTLSALAAAGVGTAVLWGVSLPGRRRLAAAAVAGVAALVAAGLVAALPPLRARLAAEARLVRGGEWNAALSGRFDGWRAAVHMLAEHPAAGVGQGAFRAEFAPAKLALLDRGVAFYPDQPAASFANAHNELLEVGADLGWPGLAALLWGIALLLVALRSLPIAGGSAALGWAGCSALAVLSLVQFPLRIALAAFPALLFLAWVFRAADEAEEGEGAPAVARPAGGRSRGGLGLALGWALAVAVLVGLVGQTLRASRRLTASRLLGRVEALSVAAARSGRAPAGILASNLADLDRAARLDPVEVEIPVARGGQFLLFGRPEAAIGPYEKALALEPHPEIYLDLARAHLALGDTERARADLATALRLSPWLRPEAPPALADATVSGAT